MAADGNNLERMPLRLLHHSAGCAWFIDNMVGLFVLFSILMWSREMMF